MDQIINFNDEAHRSVPFEQTQIVEQVKLVNWIIWQAKWQMEKIVRRERKYVQDEWRKTFFVIIPLKKVHRVQIYKTYAQLNQSFKDFSKTNLI